MEGRTSCRDGFGQTENIRQREDDTQDTTTIDPQLTI